MKKVIFSILFSAICCGVFSLVFLAKSAVAIESGNGLPVESSEITSGGGQTEGGGVVELPNFLGGTKTISGLLAKIAKFVVDLALPFAVLMIIWSGFLFATAQGNEAKITQAKKNFRWTIVGVAVILASEALLGYIEELLGGKKSGFSAFMDKIKGTLNQIIVLLFALVTVYFIWGIVQYVGAGGDEARLKTGKKHMIWGIIGMSIMASAWGIVNIIADYVQ